MMLVHQKKPGIGSPENDLVISEGGKASSSLSLINDRIKVTNHVCSKVLDLSFNDLKFIHNLLVGVSKDVQEPKEVSNNREVRSNF